MGGEWRLILDGSGGPAHNMAVDEAILHAHIAGLALPTMRFYGWDGPAVSLGYSQSLARAGIDGEYCRQVGVGVVRRMTGGRAVLHGHDLTFSVVVAENLVPEGSRNVRSSHQWLMLGILVGLRRLGFDAEMGSEVKVSPFGGDCFAHSAACDVCVGGVKTVGAAQVRRNGVILQQGSIPFQAPLADRRRIFGDRCGDEAIPLLGIGRQALVEALTAGLSQTLPVTFVRAPLSNDERLDSQFLQRRRYALDAWNRRTEPANVDNHGVSALY